MERNTDKEVLDFLDSLDNMENKSAAIAENPANGGNRSTLNSPFQSFRPTTSTTATKPAFTSGFTPFAPRTTSSEPKSNSSTSFVPFAKLNNNPPVSTPQNAHRSSPAPNFNHDALNSSNGTDAPPIRPFSPRTSPASGLTNQTGSQSGTKLVRPVSINSVTTQGLATPFNVASQSAQSNPTKEHDSSPQQPYSAPSQVAATKVNANPPSGIAPPPLKTAFNPRQHVPIHPKTKTGFVPNYDSQAQTKAFEAPHEPIEPPKLTQQEGGWSWGTILSTATKSLETAKTLAGTAASAVGTNETVRGFYKNVTPELEKLC
jgi:hypothetical protein